MSLWTLWFDLEFDWFLMSFPLTWDNESVSRTVMSNSNESVLTSVSWQHPGCNGLHTTSAHNRFLGDMSGYNGLPTVMSGLDESMSDVTPKKKYPFELEKALHNVMFIQHHIQRQDEFNAVSHSWLMNDLSTNPRKYKYQTWLTSNCCDSIAGWVNDPLLI